MHITGPAVRLRRKAARCIAAAVTVFVLTLTAPFVCAQPAMDLAQVYAREVDRRLEVPSSEQQAYARMLAAALRQAGMAELLPQYTLLVDRSPKVQAAFVYWGPAEDSWQFIGASPVSTGRVGSYDHFLTPLGVFEHTPDNMDYRAEGTFNELGIRGYGVRGMRVFDFGWVMAERGWGTPGQSLMRLQMHATDPDVLDRWLGQAASKGCIRIPASLNILLDRYGILDAEYEKAQAAGENLWILRANRQPTPWAGRYLVVVDSERSVRPDWSPPPGGRKTADAGRSNFLSTCAIRR